jgi:transcriptional regulator with XRE-family HTH domain
VEFSTIGKALRSRRQNLSIDQTRAAALVGMSRTSYSSYERDLQRPSVEVLPGLADFLEISLDDVLILYGGTCIEAVRPSLEKFVATGTVNGTSELVVKDATPDVPVSDDVHPVLDDHAANHDHGESGAQDGPEAEVEVDIAVEAEPEIRTTSEPTSASIFANELSHDNARSTSRDVANRDDRSSKSPKAKSGKKKKKKGKK